MPKYSDQRLGKDIIEAYSPFRQQKSNYKVQTLRDKANLKHDFMVPKQYQLLQILGKGSYGVVAAGVKHSDKKTAQRKNQGSDQKIVAIKKIQQPFEHKILTKRILRQLHLLKILKHENIISLQTILMPLSRQQFKNVYIAFEFMDTDLHEILRSDQELTKQHFRFFLYQIVRGLMFIHSAGVVHRDLKPRNLLVNKNCDLKICDFGLARSLVHKSKSNQLTDYVATRWYRAPELLLGSYEYTAAVDMWSVGCIFAEMLLRKPFMKGKSTKDQLQIIAEVIGTQGLQNIDSISQGGKRLLKKMSHGKEHGQLHKIFNSVEQSQLDLLGRLLTINPKKRITASEALKHPYFKQLYDAVDEPLTQPFKSCDFEFEQYNLNTQQLKDILYEQILTYNFPKFEREYQQKRKQNKSLISHILTNSNKDNRDPLADESEEELDVFQ